MVLKGFNFWVMFSYWVFRQRFVNNTKFEVVSKEVVNIKTFTDSLHKILKTILGWGYYPISLIILIQTCFISLISYLYKIKTGFNQIVVITIVKGTM